MWAGDGELDEDALPPIEALTVEPERSPADVREEVNFALGIGPRRVRYQEPGPDISDLKAALREELFG